MSTTHRSKTSRLLGLLRFALVAPVLAGALVVGAGLQTGQPAAARATDPAAKQIRANWTAFFSGATPASTKIRLLQDGTKFASVIRAQSASPIGRTTSAKVTSVKVTSKSAATVRYTILLAGQAVLKNESGESVLQSGRWKVGDVSFCALLELEQTKAVACPAQSLRS